jgi:hypothetical protein
VKQTEEGRAGARARSQRCEGLCQPNKPPGVCSCRVHAAQHSQQLPPPAQALKASPAGRGCVLSGGARSAASSLVDDVHNEAAGLQGRPLPPLVVDGGQEDLQMAGGRGRGVSGRQGR